MKLNKKEIILLLVLLTILLSYGFYKYVYLRNTEKIESLYSEYYDKYQQYEKMNDRLKIKNYYTFEFKKSNYFVNELTEHFLPELEQEKVIVFIDKYLNKYNINAASIGFTDVEFEVISKNVNETTDESNNEDYILDDLKNILNQYNIQSNNKTNDLETSQKSDNKESNDNLLNDLKDNFNNSEKIDSNDENINVEQASIESMGLNISFVSSYLDLLEFIGSLQNNPINISITNINISKSDDTTVQGTMLLKFYAVPKLYEQENAEWIWSDLIDYGKNNPFYNDIEYNSDFSESKYDFKISVKAYNSDLPTVSLSKYNDNLGKTFLYADSNNIEEISIELKEIDGDNYYRYRTQNGAYPKNDEWEKFIPENEFISFKIYSSSRINDKDKSSVKIDIKNNTKYGVYVDIFGDDDNNPRVSFVNKDNIFIKND